MPDHKPSKPAGAADIAREYATARSAQAAPPGPLDPYLEPLVWGIAARWPYQLERLRRGGIPAASRPIEVADLLNALHREVGQQAAAMPFAPLADSPLPAQASRIWDVIKGDLGQQTAWLAGLGPDDPAKGEVMYADFAVAVGQWRQAAAFQTLGRKLPNLDYLRGYVAQFRTDWRPFAQAAPGQLLAPGPAVERYNWLLVKARQTVVKQRQHVDNLDLFDLAEVERSALVLDYSLVHLLRALAFA
ncbi:MAG: hypothetical protein KIS91_15625 [Anaerolineae bacterium]|nr:hypothetical protein [Anaerolineae bacterium]